MTYALDSNIISYLLKNNHAVKQNFQNAINNNHYYVIPPIVYYEVKRWLKTRSAMKQLQFLSDLYLSSVQNDMTSDVWGKSVEIYTQLRQSGITVDDADIFTAAYCIVNNYTLVTNNTKHFKYINEMNFENWT